ncbi:MULTISPECIES: alpha/beta hydrolase family protein [unclassified Microbacterium]|uniref:alpha/beta hydrolase family protein n=1 Tax=unclassified Microbacterium TaxID=2609290 RepID=UPI001D6246DC|nr:alpha/beta fold hydrolase [Actinomycetota bacterium]MBS1899646.1 alpha/beta fold hydrolase [Actinomycetota bacterium]
MKSLRHAATVGAIAFAGVAALGAAIGGALVLRIAREVVTPAPRKNDTDVLAVDTGAQTIELGRTPDTELPGSYGLYVEGTPGYVKLGAVLHADARTVRRKLLTQIAPGAEIGRRAAFSGYYYLAPGELHVPYESVLIGTPAGPCPAWLFPAESTTWVVQVHGRGATRSECLRAVPVLHAAGLPVLVTSYRNDGEGPRTRPGSYGLGSTEWQDVDLAIAYALRHGAERILLMGWSMGGAIALQALVSSDHGGAVVGMILDSPVVDWRTVLRYQARAMRLPDPLPQLAMDALGQPWSARLSGADQAIPFDALDMVARSAELDVPILLLHSDDDGFVPADASHALAAARPDLVTMPPFTGARHTKLWNYDQNRWTDAITDWLGEHGFAD